MPELLSASIHSMIYQSRGLETGRNVTVRLYEPPDFGMGDAQPLTEIGNGIYSLAVDFTVEGLHIAQFFENGVPVTTQTYRVYRVRDILGKLEQDRARKASFRI